jgi:hypothetical protein
VSKKPTNHGKSWSASDTQKLGQLAQQNTPTRVAALKLGRTESSVRGKAAAEGISFKPTNQSPYNRRKK